VRWEEQGVGGELRHAVIPRTLCFICRDENVLLLRGAASKRLWAGKLNGIGGHIEVGETPLEGARREIAEETGLYIHDLRLRGIVHVCSQVSVQGIMIMIYVGQAPALEVRPSLEGELIWCPVHSLPRDELVEDLPELIPRVLGAKGDQFVYGLYQPDELGRMLFTFETV
jgi:8-oxo-dGTP diphosphatase